MDFESKTMHEFHIKCYSEKTGDFVGCGLELEENWTKDEIDIDELFIGMEESFWELLCEFEGSAQNAIDSGKITDVDENSLFDLFGHFHFSVTVDEEDIDFDVGVDPDEFMYSQLVEYIEVDLKDDENE